MSMISVKDLLHEYPNIRLASQADNAGILEFIKKVPMKAGQISVRYERAPDYFELIRMQGDSAFVLLAIEDGHIAGVTAITVKKTYVHGKVVKAGCIADLRVKPRLDPKIRLQWRSVYFDLVNKFANIEELHECAFMYAAVLNGNDRMMKTFKDPNAPIIHEKIDEFWTYNLFAKLPFGFKFNNHKLAKKLNMTVRRAEKEDLPALRQHLKAENLDRVLGHYFSDDSDDELSKRLNHWDRLDISSFIIAVNASGQIIGCVCPWNAAKTKKMVLDAAPLSITALGRLLPWVGKPGISTGSELKVLYLTHLEIASALTDDERQTVFEMLLKYVYDHKLQNGYHMMTFADFPARPLALGLKEKRIISYKILTSAFQLMPKISDGAKTKVTLLAGKHIGYELGVQ